MIVLPMFFAGLGLAAAYYFFNGYMGEAFCENFSFE
jgi:hypothetical protein